LFERARVWRKLCCCVLQCAAVCCSVLQCVAVSRSVLQCGALCRSVLQRAAVCCSVLEGPLQPTATHCNTLQHKKTRALVSITKALCLIHKALYLMQIPLFTNTTALYPNPYLSCKDYSPTSETQILISSAKTRICEH